jgi:hypothetical protein
MTSRPALCVPRAASVAAVQSTTPTNPGLLLQTDCATKFLNSGIGNCGNDIKCICENKEFLNGIACCLTDVCDEKEQSQAIDYAVGVSFPHPYTRTLHPTELTLPPFPSTDLRRR